MEGGVEDLLLGGAALPELDRRALASHCAAVAQHMSAIARLFDPAAKAAADKKGKKGDDDDKVKPKRELTAYNLFIQSKLAQVKEDHPELTHVEAFAQAAHAWKTDPSNPKAQAGEDKRKALEDGAAGGGDDDAAHKKSKKVKHDE